ncbi:MAG: DUF4416 family protein [Elusimicrobiota bacterium]|jgi:hypothetical protein|nr:DUF4416 family protein [Elusimicrobiota bacterium]
MGTIGKPKSVKLFCGIISSDQSIEEQAFKHLEGKFGTIDFKSEVMSFDFSNYYEPEMGKNLSRFWVSFKNLILEDELAGIKVFTNSVEDGLAQNSNRKINIDPGYVTAANIILATTKNYSHRIYLSKGIYGEVTTIYKKTGFIKLPWSYPDYLSKIAVNFFTKARLDLLKSLRALNA